jgi:hypothetical protein
MAIRVQTHNGPAIVAGDVVYRYDLFEKGVIGRLRTTSEELLTANERLARLGQEGAIILPCHDPVISETYMQHGDDWLEAIRPISERAAAGFAAAAKTLLR